MQNIIAYSRGPNLITKKSAAVTIRFPAGEEGFKTLGTQWGVSKGVFSGQPFCASEALQGSHTVATAVDSHQIVPVSGSQPSSRWDPLIQFLIVW